MKTSASAQRLVLTIQKNYRIPLCRHLKDFLDLGTKGGGIDA
jgi:hypothetical protein